ncbi:hypothetical protein [Longimycelium tulufanense]|uniref:hypothetical protein n=1 Tax=Longimycelium tulufanense TaxID=907463 RepID=UPI00166556AD|nr:hypothetical protein [Longimycelium tulufanense]
MTVRGNTEVRCIVSSADSSVEVGFDDGDECFEVVLEEHALEQCVAKFPEALRQLREATARADSDA